jgi:crotonobetainyl-CoA:carnitine CoA-transferase CaiB-like acyl-CoA transferase
MITNQPVNNHDDLMKVLDGMLAEVGLDRKDTGGKVTFAGMDPIRPTVLKVGVASAAVVAANSVAAASIWKMRSGESQDIHVDLRKAYVTQSAWQEGLENCSLLNGVSVMLDPNQYGPGLSIVNTKDNRWVLIACPYPSQQKKLSRLLNSGWLPDQMAQAVRQWDALDLEAAGQDATLPIVMCRTQEEYRSTEQYEHNAATPLIHVEKIGDSDPEPLGPAERPLSGVRVLSMVHVVAGPTVPRQLAALGADCLNLNTPHWVENPAFYWQCDIGTRQAFLDARVDKNRKQIYGLVKDADIFVENLKPGYAANEGLSAEELATYRPGIIYVTIKLSAPTGPWANWVGFDFHAGALSGLLTETGTPDHPAAPHGVNVVVDFLTGYMASLGAQAALIRRAKEGGSYKVTVTLSQTAMFMLSLGLIDKNTLLDLENMGEEHQRIKPNLQTGQTPFGEFTRLGSQVEMSKTPEYWADPIVVPKGSSKPEWLPR